VRAEIGEALVSANRPRDDAILVAVSKGQPAAALQEAYQAGQRHFGESYVQESLAKIEKLSHTDIIWHFIGRIQSNKTRVIAEHFQWVHTVDRDKTAVRLSGQRPYYAPPLNVLIQVNLAGERQKGGIPASGARALAETVRSLPRLRLRGLMTIPPAHLDAAESAAYFDELKALETELVEAGFELDTLSMGMSHDFGLALAHGSSCVRVGTAIFGPRNP
jgi:pyridoxal phosphate enzyme (YggS family)